MTLQTTLIYNELLIKKAILSYWWRVVGRKYIATIVLLSFALAYGISVGNQSWVMGMLATVLFFAIAFIVALYFVHYRNAISKFKAMGNPQATFTLKDETFSFESGAGAATLPWSSVIEVWKFADYWLFFYSKAQFSTLPAANLTPEIKAFITARINQAGGKMS